MAEDSQLTEETMRQALERLGAGRPVSDNTSSRSPRTSQGRPASHRPATSSGSSVTPQRRRRFVGEGQVVVEHQVLGRGRGNAPARPANTEDQEETERLRQALRREQRRTHDAEIEITSLQSRLHSLETGIGHLREEVKELTQKVAERDAEILKLKVEKTPAKRPVGRPPKNPQVAVLRDVALKDVAKDEPLQKEAVQKSGPVAGQQVEEEEPQPVQWWRD